MKQSNTTNKKLKSEFTNIFLYLQLRIVNKNNEILQIGEEGEIQVKSFSRFKEYRLDPKNTRNMFTDDGYLKTG